MKELFFNSAMIVLVVAGYQAIVLEHKIGINKAAAALLTAVLCWVFNFMKAFPQDAVMLQQLNEHLADISQVVFFLIGSMAVIELIDTYRGFSIITDFIRTRDQRLLLWVISFVTFFISSFLANMTVAIVMVSLLRGLIPEREPRMIFVAMVVVASNAGGAWTPIGDTTTMMLWVGGAISPWKVVPTLFLPSLVSVIVPLIYFTFQLNQSCILQPLPKDNDPAIRGRRRVFWLGIGTMVLVPVLTFFTNIPPYMGMFLSLSIMWALTDLIHQERHFLRIPHVLTKIDMSSAFFFVGILFMVAALQSAGILGQIAMSMDRYLKSKDVIVFTMGIVSAIIDNVPLTAAMMGMYSLKAYAVDSRLWMMTAYCVGTGGSLLIIGSAAGIVAMGMEKIPFGWYLRKMSLPILLGYLAGFLLIR